MPYEYTPPEFLRNQSVDEIHRRMMDAMPPDIDTSEASIPWDYTRPAAIEKARFVEFQLNQTIQIMFPHWAYGEWLDRHAEVQGITRRPANPAYGNLVVAGRQGRLLRQGFQFATQANLAPSILFEVYSDTLFDVPDDIPEIPDITIPSNHILKYVPVQALEGGTIGNVPPDSIMLMVNPTPDISFVTNLTAMTGGVPMESDDDLRERVLEAIRYGVSYAGRDADYVRWAKMIPGVGSVVVEAEWAGPGTGTVRLFIVDANGVPANQLILDNVYNYIIRPDDRMQRLAPINAILTVAAPEPIDISIVASVKLQAGVDVATVTERYITNLGRYWLAAATEFSIQQVQAGIAQNMVRYVFVGAALADTDGIVDYDHASLLVNGATDNIVIGVGTFPVTGEVTLNVI